MRLCRDVAACASATGAFVSVWDRQEEPALERPPCRAARPGPTRPDPDRSGPAWPLKSSVDSPPRHFYPPLSPPPSTCWPLNCSVVPSSLLRPPSPPFTPRPPPPHTHTSAGCVPVLLNSLHPPPPALARHPHPAAQHRPLLHGHRRRHRRPRPGCRAGAGPGGGVVGVRGPELDESWRPQRRRRLHPQVRTHIQTYIHTCAGVQTHKRARGRKHEYGHLRV